MSFVPVVGGVVMGFVVFFLFFFLSLSLFYGGDGFCVGCGCCCDEFFFQWWWLVVGCRFMVVASGAMVEAVEVAIVVGLDFLVVVYHYFNEFYIILNVLLKIKMF